MAFAAFDLLAIDGESVIAEPWTARRKRLADLLETPPPGICLVPVTDNAPALCDTWVGQGGEGIVLKERTSLYRPGIRSPTWLKLKPKLTLEVVVTASLRTARHSEASINVAIARRSSCSCAEPLTWLPPPGTPGARFDSAPP